MAFSEYAKRIRQVIDREESGNVNAAAARSDIPQRTLHKIYTGNTQEPHVGLIAKISKTYRVDPTWLITGRHSDDFLSSEKEVTLRARELCAHMLRSLANVLQAEDTAKRPTPLAETPDQIRHLADKIADELRDPIAKEKGA